MLGRQGGREGRWFIPVTSLLTPCFAHPLPPCWRSLVVDLPSSQLDASHIGNYYSFDRQLVPEAFQPFHQTFYTPR